MQSVKIRNYTPVCDLAKTGVYVLVLAVEYKAVDDLPAIVFKQGGQKQKI